MTLILELSPEKEARLRQKALAHGLALEEFAVESLNQVADEQTLAEALAGLIGVLDSSKKNGGKSSHVSENTGEEFTNILVEKRKAGHL
jgi:hypothetical protein